MDGRVMNVVQSIATAVELIMILSLQSVSLIKDFVLKQRDVLKIVILIVLHNIDTISSTIQFCIQNIFYIENKKIHVSAMLSQAQVV